MILKGMEEISNYAQSSRNVVLKLAKTKKYGRTFPIAMIGTAYYSHSSMIDEYFAHIIQNDTQERQMHAST